jgi:hypothetical protein
MKFYFYYFVGGGSGDFFCACIFKLSQSFFLLQRNTG